MVHAACARSWCTWSFKASSLSPCVLSFCIPLLYIILPVSAIRAFSTRKTSISTPTEIIPHNESMSLSNVIISFCSSASAFDGVVYSRLVCSRVIKSKSSIPPALVSIRSTHASQNNENLSCSLLELAPPAFTYDTCKSIRMPSKSLLLRINAYTHKRGSNGTVARFVPSSLHT